MSWMTQLGEELAKARRKAGMTQAELERAIGISRQSIGLYERGKIPPPFETLASIAGAVQAEQFVIEDLHITFSRNGKSVSLETIPSQLALDFDKDGGTTVRIQSSTAGIVIKALSA